MPIKVKSSTKYAVFESFGEDWQQVTVWLPIERTKELLEFHLEQYPHRRFWVMNCMEITYD